MTLTAAEVAARLDMAWVAGKCEEEGDCLLWKLSVNSSGHPKYSFKFGDIRITKQMRQVVWMVAGGRQLRAHECLTMTCGEGRCMNPEHMKVTTRAMVLARTASRPDVKRRLFVAGVKNNRPAGKITMEQARYVRESDKTLTVLSEELGVSIAWVSKIRRGEVWRELQASPFAGLGA